MCVCTCTCVCVFGLWLLGLSFSPSSVLSVYYPPDKKMEAPSARCDPASFPLCSCVKCVNVDSTHKHSDWRKDRKEAQKRVFEEPQGRISPAGRCWGCDAITAPAQQLWASGFARRGRKCVLNAKKDLFIIALFCAQYKSKKYKYLTTKVKRNLNKKTTAISQC